MPQIFAYLRVSTDAQDVDNQRHGVIDYCASNKLLEPLFIEDSISGKTDWQTRELGKLIARASAGDVVVVSEVSRLARSTLQVLEIMRECVRRQLELHVVKSRIVLDGSMQSTIVATVLGLASEIEREFISARTREALAKRKAAGMKLGRPEGPAKALRLDASAKKIDDYLQLKLDKRAIAKLLGCSPNTLYAWLKVRRPAA